jgi:hypothetical protein
MDPIGAHGKQYAASRGRIDDCKPNPLPDIKSTCNQGWASIDDNSLVTYGPEFVAAPFFSNVPP